jgi:hypothetical protein
MDFKTENVDFIENTNKELKEEITDLDLEVKIEKLDEEGYIKNEVFQEFFYSKPFQIIGEKRKHKEMLNLENKKIKEEFVVFEEIDEKEKPQEIHFDDSNNQVINGDGP